MHILELPSFFTPYGGEFCLDQAKALLAQGHEVRILSNVQLSVRRGLAQFLRLPYGRRWTEADGIAVYQHYMRGIPLVVRPNVERWVACVRSMFADYVALHGKPDILHAHCAKWAGYAAMLIAHESGLPYVVTEHLPLMALEDEFGPAPSGAWQIGLLRQTYEQASMVVPVAEELVAQTACYYGTDYRWQPLSNTIDTRFFCYRQRTSLAGRAPVFGCVADFIYRKGYDVLLPAFAALLGQCPGARLLIAGDGTDSAAFHALVAKYGLEENVEVRGRVDRYGVRALLYASDAFVLPSRSEVQPLVVLEAMSTGIPVVATESVPSNQRIEGAVRIVPIGDADALCQAMAEVASLLHNTTTDHGDSVAGQRGSASGSDGCLLPGNVISARADALASPEAVGKRLSDLFAQIKQQLP